MTSARPFCDGSGQRRPIVPLLAIALLVSGCGGGASGSAPNPPPPTGNDGLPAFAGVWTILFENEGRGSLLDDPDAVHFRQLVDSYASAAKYSATKHPSLPNYIDLTCGCDDQHTFFDIQDNPAEDLIEKSPNDLFQDANLGGELEAAGVAWRAYGQDSAPDSQLGPCFTGNTGHYVARHMPFVYFQDIYGTGLEPSSTCVNRVRTFGDFGTGTGDFYTDLGQRASDYYWITPDKIYDMHDGTVADADAFLAAVVPAIQATPQWQEGGVIFITYDEGDLLNQVLFIAVSPFAKPGYESPSSFTHFNFLATIEDIYGLPRTGRATGAPNMADLFQL